MNIDDGAVWCDAKSCSAVVLEPFLLLLKKKISCVECVYLSNDLNKKFFSRFFSLYFLWVCLEVRVMDGATWMTTKIHFVLKRNFFWSARLYNRTSFLIEFSVTRGNKHHPVYLHGTNQARLFQLSSYISVINLACSRHIIRQLMPFIARSKISSHTHQICFW